ncbi:MAG TPA: hypothetical protein PKK00_12475 [Bacteroidales bacterium]|nr:hypothetical protein [Bacteroidales bacterium]HPS18044.1 hypothetical protein [Bacteroidales bacterium]
MKNVVKTLLTAVIVFLFVSGYSQTSKAYFILNKTNEKIVTTSANGERTIIFDIAGLNSKEEVTALVEKIKTLRGVVSASFNETPVNGNWKTTVVLYKYATKQYFKSFFTWCGIEKVVIDNTTYTAQDFEMSEE